jgi:hypothetical protein
MRGMYKTGLIRVIELYTQLVYEAPKVNCQVEMKMLLISEIDVVCR